MTPDIRIPRFILILGPDGILISGFYCMFTLCSPIAQSDVASVAFTTTLCACSPTTPTLLRSVEISYPVPMLVL